MIIKLALVLSGIIQLNLQDTALENSNLQQNIQLPDPIKGIDALNTMLGDSNEFQVDFIYDNQNGKVVVITNEIFNELKALKDEEKLDENKANMILDKAIEYLSFNDVAYAYRNDVKLKDKKTALSKDKFYLIDEKIEKAIGECSKEAKDIPVTSSVELTVPYNLNQLNLKGPIETYLSYFTTNRLIAMNGTYNWCYVILKKTIDKPQVNLLYNDVKCRLGLDEVTDATLELTEDISIITLALEGGVFFISTDMRFEINSNGLYRPPSFRLYLFFF